MASVVWLLQLQSEVSVRSGVACDAWLCGVWETLSRTRRADRAAQAGYTY